MLEISDVTKTFFGGTVNERTALAGVSLTLAPGEFVTVIGSNGAGKSTLLNIVAGKLRPDGGSVTIAGKDVTRLADHQRAAYIGRVFQDPMAGTAPQMTIEENLAMADGRGRARGLRWGVTKARRERFVAELATLELGLEDRLGAKVGMLSGGQRQALSLLMATFSEPKILLLDEHTAALDPQRAALVSRLTAEAVHRHHLTTLMVTHNMEQALRLGTRLLMMHEGRVILDLDAETKSRTSVADLLHEFEKIKGGAGLDDRTLLQ
ncbi:ABC transporter ATP-binding protein [Georgenia sp. SYP-B2076]|uniref:ABC transporter ATP-binding protein n=1 Tax=Georgenia sp. SYP-B2076 TaxID=2495881 RepID=UPI000F8DB327|nr:ABC transporter ATP-binding protein [Georgenia sp. SYP-B2076]